MLRDPARDLRPGAEAELGQDVLQVALNRALRKEQALRDSTAGHPGGHQPGHLELPLAQAAGTAGCLAAALRAGLLSRQCEELACRHVSSGLPRLVGGIWG